MLPRDFMVSVETDKIPELAEGNVPDFKTVQSELAELNRSPGRTVTPVLRPGPAPVWAAPDPEADPLYVGQSLLDDLRAAGETILVLDDAHWADRQSQAALRFAARHMTGLPVLVIVIHNDEDLQSPLLCLRKACALQGTCLHARTDIEHQDNVFILGHGSGQHGIRQGRGEHTHQEEL